MPSIHKHFKIINFLLFQAIWAASVLGRADWILLPMALIALHFLLTPNRKEDLLIVAAIAAIGVAVDFALTLLGVFVFTPEFFPLWLVVLWCGFATTLNHGLYWLGNLPLYVQGGLGAVGGASSYIGGYFLGAVAFSYDFVLTSAILLVVWSVLIPLFLYIVKGAPDYAASLR